MRIHNILYLLLLFCSMLYSQESLSVDSLQTDTSNTMKEAKNDSIKYEADEIQYDVEKKMTLLIGDAVVRYDGITLSADTIHIIFSKKIALATGSPVLIDGTDTIVGESMVYNLSNKRGRVNYGTAYSPETKFTGSNITKSDKKEFYITDGAYTTCSGDTIKYCFYGHDIKVIPKDKAISRPVVLNVSEMPILMLPYFIIPLEQGRQSGWLNPKWGGNPARSAYLDHIGYYWAPNDFTDFTLYGKVNNFSDFVLNANARYALKYKFSGGITGRYALSTKSTGYSNNWELSYSHNQNLLPDESFKLSGQGSVLSSNEFYKYTSDDTTDLLKRQTNANFALSKTFKKIGGYGSIKWDRNHNLATNIVTNNIPSVAFNLNTRPLIPYDDKEEDELKFYNKIDYSYKFNANQKHISQHFNDGSESITSHNSGFAQTVPISANFKLFKYITITPYLSFSHSMFDTYIDKVSFRDTVVGIYDTLKYDSVVSEIPVDSIFDPLEDTLTHLIYLTGYDTVPVYDSTTFGDKDFEIKKAQTFNWNGGLSLKTTLYGVFPIKIFNLTGIRHTFTPNISYTFAPKSPTSKFNMKFPSIGVSSTQQESDQHKINFSINNIFHGRVNKKDKSGEIEEKKFSLFDFNMSSAYNFTKDSLNIWDGKLADIKLSASSSNKFLSLSFGSTFHPYDANDEIDLTPTLMDYSISVRPKTLSVSGDFWGGNFLIFEGLNPDNYMAGINISKKPGWNFSLSPSYSFRKSKKNVTDDNYDISQEYSLGSSAKINFTHRWSAAWSSRYDFVESEFSSHSLNVVCDLDAWVLKFDWYPTGVNAGAFRFDIRLKKHPEIKWDRRETD